MPKELTEKEKKIKIEIDTFIKKPLVYDVNKVDDLITGIKEKITNIFLNEQQNNQDTKSKKYEDSACLKILDYKNELLNNAKEDEKEEFLYANTYLKSVIINKIYSTSVKDIDMPFVVEQLCNHNQEIKDLLINKDKSKKAEEYIKIFNKLLNGLKEKKNKIKRTIAEPFSFLTKYLQNHDYYNNGNEKTSDFPIYDNFVNMFLMSYNNTTSRNTNLYNKNITAFYNEIEKLVNDKEFKFNGNYKELDTFIWFFGKYVQTKAREMLKKQKNVSELTKVQVGTNYKILFGKNDYSNDKRINTLYHYIQRICIDVYNQNKEKLK